ncbi:VapE domain-containing protein [Paraburkholderia sp. BR10936]|uniref:VapE domain-containing protein n=1 Tax=Paraburkholderia sp. BR10936 TaxID=3236993 RepID=UPI0034D1A544
MDTNSLLTKASAATTYVGWGRSIVAVRPDMKRPYNPTHPTGEGWQRRPITTCELAAAHWEVNPEDNIGWLMGEQYVTLDFDFKDGKQGRATLAWFAQRFPAVRGTLTQRSQSGAWHKVFELKPDQRGKLRKHTNAKLGPHPESSGLDIITGNAIIVVAPSTTAHGSYRWKDATVEIAGMPDDLFELLLNLERHRENVDVSKPDRSSSPDVELDDAVIGLLHGGWTEGCDYASPSEARAAVYRAFIEKGWPDEEIASVIEHSPLRHHGDPTRKDLIGEDLLRDIAKVRAMAYTGAAVSMRVPAQSTSIGGQGVSPTSTFERDGTRKNKIIPNVTNIMLALRSQPTAIRYDRFMSRVVLVRKSDGMSCPLVETDYNKMQEELERMGFKTPDKQLLRDCVERRAKDDDFDSLEEWIKNEVPEWDGVSRVDTFFATYCGAQNDPYAVAASRYLWTALAGRACSPGIKADGVIVLLGDQGIGKTSLVQALAPTIDGVLAAGKIALDTRDADICRKMQGKLVCELPELRGFGTRDQEAIKDFISATEDEWVPKYKELPHRAPRRTVFIATGNEREFLKDTTGNRRWFPIDAKQIDLALLREDVPQLWAEAVQLYRRSGVLYREAEQLSREVHQGYLKHSELYDFMKPLVLDLYEKYGPFKLETLLELMAGKEVMEVNAQTRKEVCGELRLMGFSNLNRNYAGKQERRWLRQTDASG